MGISSNDLRFDPSCAKIVFFEIENINVSSANTKSKYNPAPAVAKKTSLQILLEAAWIRIQKIQNPVHAHLCCPATGLPMRLLENPI